MRNTLPLEIVFTLACSKGNDRRRYVHSFLSSPSRPASQWDSPGRSQRRPTDRFDRKWSPRRSRGTSVPHIVRARAHTA